MIKKSFLIIVFILMVCFLSSCIPVDEQKLERLKDNAADANQRADEAQRQYEELRDFLDWYEQNGGN